MSLSQKTWGYRDLPRSCPELIFSFESQPFFEWFDHPWLLWGIVCLFSPKLLSFRQPHRPQRLPVLIFKPSFPSYTQLVPELWSGTSKSASNLLQVPPHQPCILFPSYCLAFVLPSSLPPPPSALFHRVQAGPSQVYVPFLIVFSEANIDLHMQTPHSPYGFSPLPS